MVLGKCVVESASSVKNCTSSRTHLTSANGRTNNFTCKSSTDPPRYKKQRLSSHFCAWDTIVLGGHTEGTT